MNIVRKIPAAFGNMLGGAAGVVGDVVGDGVEALVDKLPCIKVENESPKKLKGSKKDAKKESAPELKKADVSKSAVIPKRAAWVETYFKVVEILTLMFPGGFSAGSVQGMSS